MWWSLGVRRLPGSLASVMGVSGRNISHKLWGSPKHVSHPPRGCAVWVGHVTRPGERRDRRRGTAGRALSQFVLACRSHPRWPRPTTSCSLGLSHHIRLISEVSWSQLRPQGPVRWPEGRGLLWCDLWDRRTMNLPSRGGGQAFDHVSTVGQAGPASRGQVR